MYYWVIGFENILGLARVCLVQVEIFNKELIFDYSILGLVCANPNYLGS